jgi:transposase
MRAFYPVCQVAELAAGYRYTTAYFILRDKVPYRELGDQYLDAHHREHIIRHHVRRLESLGLHIDIRDLPLTG